MRNVVADQKLSKETKAALIRGGVLEALCWIAGLIAFFLTGSWVWIVSGIVAGLGFSLPAVIMYVREVKGRDRASR